MDTIQKRRIMAGSVTAHYLQRGKPAPPSAIPGNPAIFNLVYFIIKSSFLCIIDAINCRYFGYLAVL